MTGEPILDHVCFSRRLDTLLRAYKAHGVPLCVVAREWGIPRSTLYRLRDGLCRVRPKTAIKIAQAAGVELAWLCGVKERKRDVD